jgi:hypothetical protein
MKLENALRKVFSQCSLLPLLIKFPCHRFALSADPRFYREILATESTSKPSLRVIFPNWMWLNLYIYPNLTLPSGYFFSIFLFWICILPVTLSETENIIYYLELKVWFCYYSIKWSEVNAGLNFNTKSHSVKSQVTLQYVMKRCKGCGQISLLYDVWNWCKKYLISLVPTTQEKLNLITKKTHLTLFKDIPVLPVSIT